MEVATVYRTSGRVQMRLKVAGNRPKLPGQCRSHPVPTTPEQQPSGTDPAVSKRDTTASPTDQDIRHRKITGWLLGAATLYFLLARFVPWTPPVRQSLVEESYIQALHTAFINHWQFGRDFVFTYGPWGFLYGGTDPATHWISVTIWMVLSFVFWWAGWQAARACFGNRPTAWLWLFAFSAVAGVAQSFVNMDPRITGWILLFLVVHFFAEDRPWTATQALLAVSLGLISLIKFTMFLEGAVTIVIIAADTVWRQRRFPWIVLIYCASLLFFWRLAGQYWSSLLSYLDNSWRIFSGYTDAMSQVTATESLDVRLFLAGMVLLVVLTVFISWHRHRRWGIWPLTGMVFVLFSAFKYGYVRHDAHELAATSQLLLAALAVLAVAQPWVRKSGPKALLLVALAVAFAACFNLATLTRYSPQGYLPTLADTLGMRSLTAPLAIFQGNEPFIRAQETYYSGLRARFPLPHTDGSVDLYPWSQILLFANDLAYHPRPVMQSYSAYTPELAEMNAAFLRGARAPENILFSIYPIDGRLPAGDDGLSWPDLLSCYDVVGTNTNTFILLRRSPTPRSWRKVLLQDSVISFGTPAAVPSAQDGPIWAEIEINKSLAGKVISTLYKPPQISLAITLVNGRTYNFRLIPGIARAGFLVSPFIGDTKAFAQLAAGNSSGALAELEVTALAVLVGDATGPGPFYEAPIRVRFYRLEIVAHSNNILSP